MSWKALHQGSWKKVADVVDSASNASAPYLHMMPHPPAKGNYYILHGMDQAVHQDEIEDLDMEDLGKAIPENIKEQNKRARGTEAANMPRGSTVGTPNGPDIKSPSALNKAKKNDWMPVLSPPKRYDVEHKLDEDGVKTIAYKEAAPETGPQIPNWKKKIQAKGLRPIRSQPIQPLRKDIVQFRKPLVDKLKAANGKGLFKKPKQEGPDTRSRDQKIRDALDAQTNNPYAQPGEDGGDPIGQGPRFPDKAKRRKQDRLPPQEPQEAYKEPTKAEQARAMLESRGKDVSRRVTANAGKESLRSILGSMHGELGERLVDEHLKKEPKGLYSSHYFEENGEEHKIPGKVKAKVHDHGVNSRGDRAISYTKNKGYGSHVMMIPAGTKDIVHIGPLTNLTGNVGWDYDSNKENGIHKPADQRAIDYHIKEREQTKAAAMKDLLQTKLAVDLGLPGAKHKPLAEFDPRQFKVEHFNWGVRVKEKGKSWNNSTDFQRQRVAQHWGSHDPAHPDAHKYITSTREDQPEETQKRQRMFDALVKPAKKADAFHPGREPVLVIPEAHQPEPSTKPKNKFTVVKSLAKSVKGR